MELQEFRIVHSKLIEQYQFIEFHLEGIFGLIGDGNFEELTHRVMNDTMGELIRKVRFILKEKKINLLSKEDYAILDEIRDDRNYWCHSCYIEMKVKMDDTKVQKRIGSINDDLNKVESMNDKLINVFKTIQEKY